MSPYCKRGGFAPAKLLTDPPSVAIKKYSIQICDQCFNLVGEMCHNPRCVFCRKTMKEVGELLDILMIRPIIDGERITADVGRRPKGELE